MQHIALKTDDVFATVHAMRVAGAARCGFELMERPREVYYDKLKEKLGDGLTDAEVQKCRELGILADRDDQGVLLQIFTKPVGDRPTLAWEAPAPGLAYRVSAPGGRAVYEELIGAQNPLGSRLSL